MKMMQDQKPEATAAGDDSGIDSNGLDAKPPVENGSISNGSGGGGDHDTVAVKDKKRIVFTGFVASTLSEMERMARDLGAEVMSSQSAAVGATHMVMPVLGRTMRFLCALSHVSHVVSPSWIKDSHKENKFKGKTSRFNRVNKTF